MSNGIYAQESSNKVQNVSPLEFQKISGEKENKIILDVRTLKEVSGGKIPGSINIDYYSSDFKAKLGELDKEKPIMVYCKSGVRSGRTVKVLRELGFIEIYNLSGGITAWQKKGLPVEKNK